jgi:hypothetical protein
MTSGAFGFRELDSGVNSSSLIDARHSGQTRTVGGESDLNPDRRVGYSTVPFCHAKKIAPHLQAWLFSLVGFCGGERWMDHGRLASLASFVLCVPHTGEDRWMMSIRSLAGQNMVCILPGIREGDPGSFAGSPNSAASLHVPGVLNSSALV